ncbi:MAG: terminase large subunit [Oscillospiraceae bacterium]|nr:terminase large subunit [Oscillospiraceae bacterium]
MVNYIFEYWAKIKSGEIIVGQKIKKLYEKIVGELENPKHPYIFDIEKASKPIIFIEKFCRHSKGRWAGKPIHLELWQKAMIQIVYGFINSETGLRRVREWFVLVGRKNGKSTLASGIGLYEMLTEKGSQVVCAATTLKQAKIVFHEAWNMVKQSPDLSKHIRKRKDDLYFDASLSVYEPICNKSSTQDGLNAQLGIVDECHAIKDRNLYDVIKESQSTRDQPLMLTITTAGFIRESLYDSLYDYACNVLDGVIADDTFIPFLYELDDRDEWLNQDCWIKTNPGLGSIKQKTTLESYVERAKNEESFKPTVLTKEFNLKATNSNAWLPYEVLQNTSTFDINMFRGSYCVGGVDLSSTGDLTCATIICMKKNDPVKYVLQHYWIPANMALKKEKEDGIPYTAFMKQGVLSLSGYNKINYSDVTDWFDLVVKELKIIPYKIGYDEWNSSYWVQEMQQKGFDTVAVRQGYKSVSPAMKEMEADFRDKLINYNNNKLLFWCLTNTTAIFDAAGNIKFDKSSNKKKRIDGTASLYCGYRILLDHHQQFLNLIK